jgi:hypothetical protein
VVLVDNPAERVHSIGAPGVAHRDDVAGAWFQLVELRGMIRGL